MFLTEYPEATFISEATTNYNCHSMAWYNSSFSNIYWIENPSSFMYDGSYAQILWGYAQSGDVIYYGSAANHSAVVVSMVPSIYAEPYQSVCVSKWGTGPRMQHRLNYGPYDASNLTFWH